MMHSSILLSPDWMLTRYAGWRQIHRDDNSLIIEKGHYPFRRICILSALSTTDFFAQHDIARFRDGMTILIVKFIQPEDDVAPITRLHGLVSTPDARRMFHKYTFVIDLSMTVDQLWMAMRPTNRNLCRKAEQAGVHVRLETAPTVEDIDRFLVLYGEMARSRGLAIPQRTMLMTMFANRQLILACAEKDGATLSMALVYLASQSAMYLYSVTPGRNIDGVGHLLQWEVMQELKSRGISQYDLGGVPRVDDSDGIFKFKKGFGGMGQALGPEFNWAPVWIKFIRRLKQWLKRRSSQK